ncbi:hypothetical protein [Parasediminibacterium sp. JCM 36343]|uniref:hypothetical protein n=1 Tax=Parasediminibacterium sp. JCM 36343 TaxID=3374279 RepID=UPI0039793E10
MPHNPNLIEKRNEKVVDRFRYHKKKNPKWTIVAVMQEVADEMFLTTTTVGRIIKSSRKVNVPDVKTVKRHLEKP